MRLTQSQYIALALAVSAAVGALVESQVFSPEVTAGLAALVVFVKALLRPPASTPG